MADQEVGRWRCEKCNHNIVAAGPLTRAFKGTGAYTGHCPWECGAWFNRAFRLIKPGEVRVYRADHWDQRSLAF
jgi:hypothetical protein